MPGRDGQGRPSLALDAATVTKVPSSDEDMGDPWKDAASKLPSPKGKREPGGAEPSPKRHRELAVDMNALRLLLDDQAKTIMAAQDRAVQQAINGLEAKHGQVLDRLARQQEVHGADIQQMRNDMTQQQGHQNSLMAKLEATSEDVLHRLAKLEQAKSCAFTAVDTNDDGGRHRNLLIFGGWPRGSRRATVLKQMEQALQSLALERSCDSAPYTTGPPQNRGVPQVQAAAW